MPVRLTPEERAERRIIREEWRMILRLARRTPHALAEGAPNDLPYQVEHLLNFNVSHDVIRAYFNRAAIHRYCKPTHTVRRSRAHARWRQAQNEARREGHLGVVRQQQRYSRASIELPSAAGTVGNG